MIIQAFTCVDWVCDLIEFPITFPFGLLFLAVLRWLDPIFFFGSITYAHSGIGFSSFRPPNAEQTLDDITLAMAKSIQLYTRLTGILTNWLDKLDPAKMSMADGLKAFSLLAPGSKVSRRSTSRSANNGWKKPATSRRQTVRCPPNRLDVLRSRFLPDVDKAN